MLAEGTVQYGELKAICRNIWWNEVVAILAGITVEPTKLIDALLNGFDRDPSEDELPPLVLPLSSLWLAGRSVRLVPENGGERARKTSEVLEGMEAILDRPRVPTYLRFDALRAVSEIDDDRAVKILIDEMSLPSSRIEREL